MDNWRMIAAFAASAVILIVWAHFFQPKREMPAPTPTAQTETSSPSVSASGDQAAGQTQASTATSSSETATTAQPASSSQVAANAASGDDVVVDTPLYRAVFNQKGAGLKSLTLKKYYQAPEHQGGNYELVEPDMALPALSLALPKADPQLVSRIYSNDQAGLEVAAGQKKDLVFQAQGDKVKVEQAYAFSGDSYAYDLTVRLTNTSDQPLDLTPEAVLRHGAHKQKANPYAFTGVLAWVGDSLKEEALDDLEKSPVEQGQVDWVAASVPYFMGALAPLDKDDQSVKRAIRGANVDGIFSVALVEPLIHLNPGQSTDLKYLVYFGPRDLDVLEPLGHKLASAVDFGWFDIIAKPMLAALKFVHGYVGNWGLAIIIITIIIKLLFWPLAQKSYKSMKRMQQLSPQVAKLREKYKDDKEAMNREMMQLYKTYKVNPMGGCMPMLVQIPVFIAFYKVLGASIELRHAPFLAWINDLSAPDRLAVGFHIPYVGDGIPVLTLLMGASMFLQQKMTPSTGDPTQQKMMMLMPLVFTVMFINFPSGLVLYWLVNNILSIGQQYYINRSKA